MASLLAGFVNNLAEGIHKSKYKYRHDNKNMKLTKLNKEIVNAVLSIQELKLI